MDATQLELDVDGTAAWSSAGPERLAWSLAETVRVLTALGGCYAGPWRLRHDRFRPAVEDVAAVPLGRLVVEVGSRPVRDVDDRALPEHGHRFTLDNGMATLRVYATRTWPSVSVAPFRAARGDGVVDDAVVDDAVVVATTDLLTTLVTTWDGESARAHHGRTVVAEVVPPRVAVLSEARGDEAGDI
ncbi:hypothetical protein DEJ13_08290 [Curtobacterium sp. MCLR17_007]|uniref:hypothetical protein n=1 Tax=unclassified Curtobacterium TaxID=257496 RepID=UPI0011B647F6|nr:MULTISPECIES: hypothetical protein [unclassified Curtobacterium]WIB61815.1 hypothetical protein DEJ13_08290 [Curtobacterium sp. MCLR17_007]